MGDLREELEEAFEEEEQEELQNDQDDSSEETDGEDDDVSETEGEGDDQDTEGDGEGSGQDQDDETEGAEGDGDGDPSPNIGDAEGKGTPEGIGAPLGFSPESREQWKNVPELVKTQIHKREQEIETAMKNTGEYRRTHTAISNLAQSYAPILAAEGAQNPMQAIEGLFKTVAELRVGSPQQRAVKMANLIGHYGVDIGMLDQALAGEEVQSTEVTQMSQMLDQRLAPLQDMLKGQQNDQVRTAQANQQVVNTELEKFSETAEFLNDVRYDMADLIDLASKQGRKMSFKEAYDKACSLNPSINKVLGDRARETSLKNSGKRRAGKKNASSSLRAKSGNAGRSAKNKSLRGEIESLWDDYS